MEFRLLPTERLRMVGLQFSILRAAGSSAKSGYFRRDAALAISNLFRRLSCPIINHIPRAYSKTPETERSAGR